MAEGLLLRITHLGLSTESILIDDVEDGTNQPGTQGRVGGVYVPVGGFIELVFTATVAVSYESGVIRGFVNSGQISAAFFPGAVYDRPMRVGPWEERIYDDLRPIEVHRIQGVGAPDSEALTENFYSWAFDNSTAESLSYVFHLSHRFARGTQPTFHIHTTHNIGSPTGTQVRWNTTWYYAKGYGEGTFPTTGTVVSGTQTVSAAYVHDIYGEDPAGVSDVFTCPSAFVPDLEPDGLVTVVLTRDATHVDDDFDHDYFVITADLHVERERIGTTERNRPFTSAGF